MADKSDKNKEGTSPNEHFNPLEDDTYVNLSMLLIFDESNDLIKWCN